MSRIVAIVGGVQKPMTRIRAVVGGTPTTITRVMAKVGGTMQQVYSSTGTPPPVSSLAASAMPGSVQGTDSGTHGTKTVYTGTTMVSASGGTPPYSYTWLKRFGSSGWVVGNAAASSTNFRCANMNVGDHQEAAFYCVVTDSATTPASVTSNDVIAATDYFDG